MSLAFWVCAVVTLISAGVSLGYSIAGLRAAEPTSRPPSMYAFARSLALAVVAVVALFAASVPFLAASATAMILVQAADTVIGVVRRRRLETVGPALTAVLNVTTLTWMLLG